MVVTKLLLILLLLESYAFANFFRKPRNVCPSFIDYFIMDISKNCYFNEDVGADLPRLVKQNNYPLQSYEYKVKTEDGYLLSLYRLPNNPKRKGVVFLQHTIMTTCNVFLDKGDRSLGYILYKQGYDVWLGNSRGNFYSNKHKSLNPQSKEYWDFSYHEMGVYDIPASIDFVKTVTGVDKLAFVGNSLSGTTAAVYASLKPDHAKASIKVMVLMTPGVYLHPISTPLWYLAQLHELIYKIADALGINMMFDHHHTRRMTWLFYNVPVLIKPCWLLLQLVAGYSPKQVDPLLLPILYSQTPNEVSTKTLNHLGQNIASGGKFQRYDYGIEANLVIYGSEQPPDYPINNITVPLYVLSGSSDRIVRKKGVDAFYKNVSTVEEDLYGHDTIEGFNHIDFLYGKDVAPDVYGKIVEVLKNVYKK